MTDNREEPGQFKMFRHTCLDGTIWDYSAITPFKIPSECQNKQDCGMGWQQIDLSMYPNGSPLAFLKEVLAASKEAPEENK